MSVVVITPPEPIVTLEEAKIHCRIDDDEEDSLIASLVLAAQGNIDGPGGWLGRAIGVQTLEWHGDGFGCIRLPYPPLVSVESVTYTDPAGAPQVLAPAAYRILDRGELAPVYGGSWPSSRCDRDAVRVVYQAGYEEVPEPIRVAVLMLVGHLYHNRQAVTSEPMHELPWAVNALLSPYRIFSL